MAVSGHRQFLGVKSQESQLFLDETVLVNLETKFLDNKYMQDV